MPLKMDKFTWAVVGIVILLLVGAVITSILTGGADAAGTTYLDADSPEATVRNAYVAFLNNDPTAARQYYSSQVLENAKQNGTFSHFSTYTGANNNQRLRILDVEMRGEDEAAVTIAIDRYGSGGLFDGGSTWTERQVLPLVREDGEWKIDTLVFFY